MTGFATRWRYRVVDRRFPDGMWTYAESMRDVERAATGRQCHVEVQRRAGSARRGYRYVAYGFIAPDGTAVRSTALTVAEYAKRMYNGGRRRESDPPTEERST